MKQDTPPAARDQASGGSSISPPYLLDGLDDEVLLQARDTRFHRAYDGRLKQLLALGLDVLVRSCPHFLFTEICLDNLHLGAERSELGAHHEGVFVCDRRLVLGFHDKEAAVLAILLVRRLQERLAQFLHTSATRAVFGRNA